MWPTEVPRGISGLARVTANQSTATARPEQSRRAWGVVKAIAGWVVEIEHETAGTYTSRIGFGRDGAAAKRDYDATIEECNRWGRMYTVTTVYADGSRRTC